MWSRALRRRSRSLLNAPVVSSRSIVTARAASPAALQRTPPPKPKGSRALRPTRRSSLTSTAARHRSETSVAQEQGEQDASLGEPSGSAPDEPPESTPPPEPPEADKARRGRKPAKDAEPSPGPLPAEINVLWSPEDEHPPPNPSALPSPEIFEETLNHFHIILHPRTQQRAAYQTSSAPSTEPTLALYCPIEGGDYVIDETVRELARRTGADVVVIDAVQLAAGECGHFGKASEALNLPSNPLHFPSHGPHPSTSGPSGPMLVEEEEEEDDGPRVFGPSMTVHLMESPSGRPGRARILAASSRNTTALKKRALFDRIISLPSSAPSSSGPTSSNRPRIIYMRDYPTLAPTAASWYPSLLAAVRLKRQGSMPRPTSPVSQPLAIVFGMTPSIAGPPPMPSGGSQSMINILTSRQRGPPALVLEPRPGSGRGGWHEDELSDKGRERRLRDKLRRWERGDSLLDEMPRPPAGEESASSSRPSLMDGKVIVSGELPPNLPSIFRQLVAAREGGDSPSGSDDDGGPQWFRSSVIVPSARSLTQERSCRVARRQEINALTMRMGVAGVGGLLKPMDPVGDSAEDTSEGNPTTNEGVNKEPSDASQEARQMWAEWGRRIEVWSTVRQIADQAVGSVVASNPAIAAEQPKGKEVLEPTEVPWTAVHKAWSRHQTARDVRKAWMRESTEKVSKEREEDEDEEDEEDGDNVDDRDEVIERVKRDPDLDQHEQRLLGCIVNAASMPTSFSQVHLPANTIDAVRTIVSLPLLYPDAFNHGILKQHGMTGCLLFGPPGTGKTLLARALAKEAGCRMLAISPSDVMDMYVGEGEKLVKSVFSLARRLSPCVVFIDEIDALFGARVSGRESGGAIAHRGVLTEFMQEMDGLKSSREDNVIVIGATNRPFDLDDAVLRRLPRRLLIDLPGEPEREAILRILLREECLSSDVDLKGLAKRTETFSGSDLKHLCVAAALDAVKERVSVPWSESVTGGTHAASASGSTKEVLFLDPSAAQAASSSTSPSSSDTSKAVSDHEEAAAPAASISGQEGHDQPAAAANSAAAEVLDRPTTPTLELPFSGQDNTPDKGAPDSSDAATASRMLSPANFAKALKEITPSASESLGTLSDLRKWNAEFGEGRKDKKMQVWGKGRFGFVLPGIEEQEEGRVGKSTPNHATIDQDTGSVVSS